MRVIIGERQVAFLGDLDPVDIMVFLWLRSRLDPIEVGYLGISDNYLEQIQVKVPESYIQECSRLEIAALPLLSKIFPDMQQIIGSSCELLLSRGRKIEIAATVSAGFNFKMLLSAVKHR
jgi:hypothetical protein